MMLILLENMPFDDKVQQYCSDYLSNYYIYYKYHILIILYYIIIFIIIFYLLKLYLLFPPK